MLEELDGQQGMVEEEGYILGITAQPEWLTGHLHGLRVGEGHTRVW
jgi:hypothetical protein